MASSSGPEQGGGAPLSDTALTHQLYSLYLKRIKPLEDMYSYEVFRPTWFEETILNPRPLVTFFGPWSSGKSTFINYLLQNNYLWTGPQPTTAKFTVVVHGKEAGPLDGRVLVNAKNLPFRGLNTFGDKFLENFQGFQAPHPLLEKVTLVDTPGVLEGAKDVHERPYDYVKVCRWFVERSDLVFFLFDPTKLDSGNELRLMFTEALKGHEGKLRIILNKADMMDTQALMRVYGSLFWNLSSVVHTTEPPRVYVGSFWDQPCREGTFTPLFSEEKSDLLHELIEIIPQQARDKKVALLIRRAKDVLTHAAIVGGMKSHLPVLFFKEKAKKKALENLPRTYEVVAAQYKLNASDFPPVAAYRDFLAKFNVEKFPEIEKAERRGLIAGIRECIDSILPGLLRPVRNYGPVDPRNGTHTDDLKRRYQDAMQQQNEGRSGIQGSTDTVGRTSPQATEEPTAPAVSPQQTSTAATQPLNAPMDATAMAHMQAMYQQMLAAQTAPQAQSAPPAPPPQPVVTRHEDPVAGVEGDSFGDVDIYLNGYDSEPATVVAHGRRESAASREAQRPPPPLQPTFANIQYPSKEQ